VTDARDHKSTTTGKTGTDGTARDDLLPQRHRDRKDERVARRRYAAAPVAKNGENASARH